MIEVNFKKVKKCSLVRVAQLVNELLDEDERIEKAGNRLYRAKSGDGFVVGSLTAILCVKIADLIKKIRCCD